MVCVAYFYSMSLSRIREIEVNLHSKLMTKNDEHNEAFKRNSHLKKKVIKSQLHVCINLA